MRRKYIAARVDIRKAVERRESLMTQEEMVRVLNMLDRRRYKTKPSEPRWYLSHVQAVEKHPEGMHMDRVLEYLSALGATLRADLDVRMPPKPRKIRKAK